MMRFEDKVVIITGASSGIGEGVAKKFLEEGALVVDVYKRQLMQVRCPKCIR